MRLVLGLTLDVRDLGGHLDTTFRGWSATLASRVRLVIFRLVLIFVFCWISIGGSVFAKLSKLSSQELLKLSEQCSALAKDRDPDLGMDEPALLATEEDDAQGT